MADYYEKENSKDPNKLDEHLDKTSKKWKNPAALQKEWKSSTNGLNEYFKTVSQELSKKSLMKEIVLEILSQHCSSR
jgi:hypothetical protein